MDAAHELVGWDTEAVMMTGGADLAQVIAVGDDRLLARLGSDQFFSGLGREGAGILLPDGGAVDALDGDWAIADGWTGRLLLKG